MAARLATDRTEVWEGLVRSAQKANRPELVRYGLEHLALLAPGDFRPLTFLAWECINDGAHATAATLLRLAARLAPTTAGIHNALVAALYHSSPVEDPPPAAFSDALRRWIILDSNFQASGDRLVQALRRLGDVDLLVKLVRWTSVIAASNSRDLPANPTAVMLQRYAAMVRAFDTASIERDFPATLMNGRVLLQPRLPNDGTWAVHGADAVQRRRAVRILTYVNPDARIVDRDTPEAKTAQVVSIDPSDDPAHTLLPCLYGHWHVYWTNLWQVLDEGAVPQTDRLLAYALRTRDFATFIYAKGHEAAFLRDNRARGRRIADRLSDAASRQSYLETLTGESTLYFQGFYRRVCHRVQYFDYAVYRPGDVILNLGVSEGFEVPAYLALISPGGELHNIDPEGAGTLGAPARTWIDGSDCGVHFHAHALSDVDGDITMETGGCWEDTRIGKRQQGKVRTIPASRLDTFVKRHGLDRIDHIKLDIEGGEEFLLDQLIEVMRSHRPQIEISIYHTVEPFFDIPERLLRRGHPLRDPRGDRAPHADQAVARSGRRPKTRRRWPAAPDFAS
jgi:FkbM family methyltransferase